MEPEEGPVGALSYSRSVKSTGDNLELATGTWGAGGGCGSEPPPWGLLTGGSGGIVPCGKPTCLLGVGGNTSFLQGQS